MAIEEGLYEFMTQDVYGVASLVGTDIYFIRAPKEVNVPFVVINTVSSEYLHTMEGTDDLIRKRFQFDVFSDDYYNMRAIARAIRSLLEGFKGDLPDGSVVGCAETQLDIDHGFEKGKGPDGLVFRGLLDIALTYVEAT
jgi:hypothetical protein